MELKRGEKARHHTKKKKTKMEKEKMGPINDEEIKLFAHFN